MFPEHTWLGAWSLNLGNNANDIIMYGMHGSCKDKTTEFPGKILYLNGEPYGDKVSDAWDRIHTPNVANSTKDVYQIGPYWPKENGKKIHKVYFFNTHSLQVYWMVMVAVSELYARFLPEIEQNQTLSMDLWKQLVHGNGRSAEDNSKDSNRIQAAVYINSNCVEYRQKAAERLAREFRDLATSRGLQSFVHHGGLCKVEGSIPVPSQLKSSRDNFSKNHETVLTRYKYCLVMENTKLSGYITEKLLYGLLGGCLPIYYGTREVYQIFRNDAFVFYDIHNPQPAVDEIWSLEQDDALFRRRTNRSLPLLQGTETDPHDTAKTLDDYFSILPGIGNGTIQRRIYEMMGLEPLSEALSPRV